MAIDTTEHDDNGIRPDEAIMVRYHPLRREFSLAEGPAPGTHSYLGSLAAAFSAGSWQGYVVNGGDVSQSRPGWQSLFTDRAIERFAEEVCVAGVAGSLLDEVQQQPPEREVPPVTQRPGR